MLRCSRDLPLAGILEETSSAGASARIAPASTGEVIAHTRPELE